MFSQRSVKTNNAGVGGCFRNSPNEFEKSSFDSSESKAGGKASRKAFT
jgi:hypothetical protein